MPSIIQAADNSCGGDAGKRRKFPAVWQDGLSLQNPAILEAQRLLPMEMMGFTLVNSSYRAG
ncbi:MAG: hypothetical protein FWD67_01145 [Betaproteobacteria bacterium]|nr:hypothetical protein [Betaproteobacteria bacterium]